MKYALSMLFCAMLAVTAAPCFAQDFSKAPQPTSFRGAAWGTPLEELPDMLPVQEPGFKNTYFRTEEPKTFGDAEIQSVAYYFRKGKLYRVGVAFTGRANHFLIKEQLLRMYGRGRGVGTRYGWMWPDFSVEITYDDEHKLGGLYYTYEGPLK